MAGKEVYKRGHFVVFKNYSNLDRYYTIVNLSKSTHCHVNGSNFEAAVMICRSAYKHEVPDRYPIWMKNSINRIL